MRWSRLSRAVSGEGVEMGGEVVAEEEVEVVVAGEEEGEDSNGRERMSKVPCEI